MWGQRRMSHGHARWSCNVAWATGAAFKGKGKPTDEEELQHSISLLLVEHSGGPAIQVPNWIKYGTRMRIECPIEPSRGLPPYSPDKGRAQLPRSSSALKECLSLCRTTSRTRRTRSSAARACGRKCSIHSPDGRRRDRVWRPLWESW